jgi:hypothetical protein
LPCKKELVLNLDFSSSSSLGQKGKVVGFFLSAFLSWQTEGWIDVF